MANLIKDLFCKFPNLGIKFKKENDKFSLSLRCPITNEVVQKVSCERKISRKKTKEHLAEKLLNPTTC